MSAPGGETEPATTEVERARGFGHRLDVTFEAFHEYHCRVWLRYATLHTGNSVTAEDIVRAASQHLADCWPRALREPSVAFYAWAILKEHVAAWAATHRRATALIETAAFEAAATALPDRHEEYAVLESRISLYAAISRLPERQCDVIVLRYALGYDDTYIAALLGVDETAVRSHGRDAKRKLAAALGAGRRAVRD